MTAWPIVALSEVADLNPRLRANLDDDAVVSFLGMANVAEDGTTTKGTERTYSEVKKGFTPFESGDILLAKITPCFQNGKIVQAKVAHPYGFGSTEFHVIRSKDDQFDHRYGLHYLRQQHIRVDGERRMTGSGGQRRVPADFLKALPVPLPPLPEQRRIAAILDYVDTLRTKRREALAKLDELTQSIFIQLFGDPATNPQQLPVVTIGEMLDSANYGTSEKSGATGKFPVLRMGNITYQGQIDLTDLKYMDLEDAKVERFTVRAGDVVFNRTNSPDLVGKTAVYRGAEPLAYAGYLVRLRTKDDSAPEYISAFLNSRYGKAVLRGICKSIVGMANINAREVQSIKIPQPATAILSAFNERVAVVEQNKAQHRAALAELDDLFASIQSRAFRGEL
ncbi:restriction endonuclease subunit S [Rhodococcus erythropolis]|uniref:restriction endonuclease subunit S n=1 Tax=Rhodococcus erythropolis TaxID=1833 RepID=UPI00294942B0|nr:restriction endonuclease subunit S [Rhodococcus erythropolis]MDV6278520.1 restriction endonuclease subunit S [Rhodococcus erythropolis]